MLIILQIVLLLSISSLILVSSYSKLANYANGLPKYNYNNINIKNNNNVINPMALHAKKITPSQDFQNMDEYRKAVLDVLKSQAIDKTKLGGRELLDMIIRKWGVAYDIQLRKSAPFGEGSANIYVNVMWRYFGQKTFTMNEKQYLEHLEAIGRYITAMGKAKEFKQKVADSRKRPNAYFGYAVPFSLDVDPSTADAFFKDLPYE